MENVCDAAKLFLLVLALISIALFANKETSPNTGHDMDRVIGIRCGLHGTGDYRCTAEIQKGDGSRYWVEFDQSVEVSPTFDKWRKPSPKPEGR